MTNNKKIILKTLKKNLHILQERQAKYAGESPLALINEIADHKKAIDLTRQSITGEISEVDWNEGLKPLNLALNIFHPTPIPLQRPRQVDHFVNRETELNQLLTDLQLGQVVTLCGPGGIGKTALAAKAVWTLAPQDKCERFLGGIILHNFYNQSQVDLAFEKIAYAFGDEPKPTPKAAAQRVLANKKALLILDGAEQADNLQSILEISDNCGVLITSRKRKDALAIRQDIKPLINEEAIKLLQKWGGKWVTNKASSGRICELVGGLPLAVRLVGRYLSNADETDSHYLTWLESTPLEALDPDGEQRRLESVPYLLERSLEQLSEQAKTVLALIGQLALAPFKPIVLKEVLELEERTLKQALNELTNYGFLISNVSPSLGGTEGGQTYEVYHALIHTYACEKLNVDLEVFSRLATYYNQLARTESKAGLAGYRRLDVERPHLMNVLEGCVERKMWEMAQDLVRAVNDYFDLQGYNADRVTVLEAGIKAAQQTNNSYNFMAFSNDLGTTCWSLGQVEQAIVYWQQILLIAKTKGGKQSEGVVLGNLGTAYSSLGQVEKAITYYEQALAISQGIEDRRVVGNHLGNLGLAYSDLGQVEKAITYYEQALAIAQEIGDRRNEGMTLGNLGLAYSDLGQVEKAITYYEQALVISQEIGNRRVVGNHLGNLGTSYRDLGEVEEAITYYKQALAIAQEIDDRRNEGNWLGNLGLVYSDLGQVDEAITYYEQALAIAQEVGDRQNEGNWLGNLGNIYYVLGQAEKAINYHQRALTIAQEIGDRRAKGNHLGNLGIAYYFLEKVEKAISYYEQALAIAQEIRDKQGEGAHLGNLGVAYQKLGQLEKAISYYEKALAIAQEIRDKQREGAHLGNLGVAYQKLGQLEKTISYYEQALAIAQEIGDKRGEGYSLGNLGNAYRNLGQLKKAKEYLKQALTIFETIKSPQAEKTRQLLANLDK